MLTSIILDNRHFRLLWGGATSLPDGIFEVWSMVNHSCQILNSSTIIFFFPQSRWYLNLWKQICEWSGVRFWPPGPVRFSVSSVGQPLFLHQLQEPLFLHQTQEPGKKHLWKTLELFSFFDLVTSSIKLYQRHNEPLSVLAKVTSLGHITSS